MDKIIIDLDGQKVTMRKPKVRDIKAVAHITNEIEKEAELISNLTGLSEEEIEEMYYQEYAKLQKALLDFL